MKKYRVEVRKNVIEILFEVLEENNEQEKMKKIILMK